MGVEVPELLVQLRGQVEGGEGLRIWWAALDNRLPHRSLKVC